MEYRDLYDKNRVPTGEKIERHEAVPAGKYYVTVMVFVENSKGEILLQRRSASKGGQWATTGGHPKSGETSVEGMIAEIKEELGICVDETELTLYKTIQTEDDFVDLYSLKKDIDCGEMKLQDEEVQDVAWFSKQEIEKMIKNGTFFKYHIEPYRDYLNSSTNK
jgi:8-oxo-dGTP pyrophosphatase MutT (NUDIX family)